MLKGIFEPNGNPVLVIETVSVVILPFNEVSEQFAFEEGEGDRSLAYWRMAHENYFRRNHFENRTFDETMLLVCERFKVVHKKQGRPESRQGGGKRKGTAQDTQRNE